MSIKVSKRILPKMVFGIIGVFIFFIGALSGFPIPNFVAFLGIKTLSKSGGTEEEYLTDNYYPLFAHNLQLAGGAA